MINAIATIQFGGEVHVVPIHKMNDDRKVLVSINGHLEWLIPDCISYEFDDPLRNVKRGNRLIIHYAGHPLCGNYAGQTIELESAIDNRLAHEEWEATA